MVNSPSAKPLKKVDFLYLRSHRLRVSPQLGVRADVAPCALCWTVAWMDLVLVYYDFMSIVVPLCAEDAV